MTRSIALVVGLVAGPVTTMQIRRAGSKSLPTLPGRAAPVAFWWTTIGGFQAGVAPSERACGSLAPEKGPLWNRAHSFTTTRKWRNGAQMPVNSRFSWAALSADIQLEGTIDLKRDIVVR